LVTTANGDLGDPWAERAAILQIGQSPVSGYEGFLSNVLCRVIVAQHIPCDAENEPFVPAHELSESVSIARDRPLNQFG
jgi:hypothetical protein